MIVQRGDVILVSYPFASGTGTKVRPALVVQCDRNNGRLDNTIVVQITTRTRLARSEPTQLFIPAASPEGQQAGLITDSAVSCENVYTVRQDSVVRKIGTLSGGTLDQVDVCLRESLDLV
jgi:mRNA interferase MazF